MTHDVMMSQNDPKAQIEPGRCSYVASAVLCVNSFRHHIISVFIQCLTPKEKTAGRQQNF